MKETLKYLTCDCHGHGLLLDYFIQTDVPCGNELYITVMGSESYFKKDSLKERIKLAIRALRKGHINGGEVVLSENNAADLVAYINNFLITAEKDLPIRTL